MLAGEASFGPPGGRGPRQLRRLGGTHFDHDLAGRLTAAGPNRMAYDGFGHLAAVWREQPAGPHQPSSDAASAAPATAAAQAGPAGNSSVSYVYGFDGELAYSRGDAGVRRQFFADLEDVAGRRIRRVEAAGRTVARLPVGDEAHGARFTHPGLAAGTRLLTDARGHAIDTRRFTPCGVSITAHFGLDPRSADDKPRDPITGWADHGARWVAPQFAQWLTPDPASLAPSPDLVIRPWDVHPYAFNRNNSQLYRDPDGQAAQLVAGAVGALSGAAIGGGLEVGRQVLSGELNLRSTIAASSAGGIAGGTAGLTCGASLLVHLPAMTAGGAIGSVAGDLIHGDSISLRHAAARGAMEGVTAGAGRLFSQLSSMRTSMEAANPRDIVQFERYKDYLVSIMDRPMAIHTHALNLAAGVFSARNQTDRTGNGSTGAAVRCEREIGEPVKGKYHSEKAEGYRKNADRLLDIHRHHIRTSRNKFNSAPQMSENDIMGVEHNRRDLDNSLRH